MSKNAIFLSGWEYNRVLQQNPLAPTTSALPAEMLWNGAAQFWLFEKVYCTKESLESEVAAADTLGWATGTIFEDLQKRGFLQPFDWKDLESESPVQQQYLLEVHHRLHAKYNEAAILTLLKTGNASELEAIKLHLLNPILTHLNCVQNISPNSIQNWISSRDNQTRSASSIPRAVRLLVQPLMKRRTLIRAGLRLCRPPGKGVSEKELRDQKEIEQTVEKPLIPYLLAGKLPQQEYLGALVPYAKSYAPINQQLKREYAENLDRLERLRELAKKHLWPELHEEWLPQLEEDEHFLPKFEIQLRDALLRARLDPYLENLTDTAITVVSGLTGFAVGKIMRDFGQPLESSAATAATVGAGMKQSLDAIHKRSRNKTNNLTLFYQKAFRELKEK